MIRRERVNRVSRRHNLIVSIKCLFFTCVVATYAWYYHGWMALLVKSDLIELVSYNDTLTVDKKSIQEENNVLAEMNTASAIFDAGDEGAVEQHDHKTMTQEKMDRDNDDIIAVASARYPNGTLGYVADPTALRKGIASFLSNINNTTSKSHLYDEHNMTTLLSIQPQLYWKLLQDYPVEYTNENDTDSSVYSQEILSSEYICALGPGRGFEQDYGYRLLSEKIQIYKQPMKSSPRILCLVYTYPKMRYLQQTQALTWGYRCNGYLAFSTETITNLGLVDLQHDGDESYDNMWLKVRAIWKYVYQHYRNDYDFFHLGGDDLYVIVENMRKFLSPYMTDAYKNTPVYLGQWIPLPGKYNEYYVSGGPGYTLNRVALTRLVEDALPSCRANIRASYEDRLISHCLRAINISGGDTRDTTTGEQLYHDCSPAHLYTFQSTRGRGSFHAKAAAYWETLPHPTNASRTVGPKHELQGAAHYSITFHDIYRPSYMTRLHSILYEGVCDETTTVLGRALATQCKV